MYGSTLAARRVVAVACALAAFYAFAVPASAQGTARDEAPDTAQVAAQAAGQASAQDKDQLYVAEFAWTNRITADRGIEQQFTETAPVAPITLWTRMVGSAKALDLLRTQNRLPIWHQWYVSCGAEVDFTGASRPTDEVDLRIEGPAIMDALAQEVRSRDFFDWRTWSRKERVTGCRYTVRIVDNQADPIYCEKLDGACEITITLGN